MGARGLPEPDLTHIKAIDPTLVVQAYLATSSKEISLKMLQSRLKTIASPATVKSAVESLIAGGLIPPDSSKLRLPDSTEQKVFRQIGLDARTNFPQIRDKWLTVQALGHDPKDEKIRAVLARAETLKHAIIGNVYGLPRDAGLKSETVRTEVAWRALRATFGEDFIGRPLPKVASSNAIARSIIAHLANTKVTTMSGAIGALAAKALGAKSASSKDLRTALVRCAIASVRPPDGLRQPVDFADRVKTVAKKLNTPPFRGKVAIAQVYDEFGRSHQDAGSLASFKERLVDAAKARALDLGRLDMPEHMNRELRERSITKWGSDEVHFIVTEWV